MDKSLQMYVVHPIEVRVSHGTMEVAEYTDDYVVFVCTECEREVQIFFDTGELVILNKGDLSAHHEAGVGIVGIRPIPEA